MKMLILISMLISYLLTLSSHPMIMISLISTQALLACMMLWLSISSPWFSYILFLVFMGGLMVLFIYISSLASNESISLELSFIPLKTLPLISLLVIYLIIIFNTQIFKESNLASSLNMVFKVYSPNIMFMTTMTMMYLLLALIIIVKITTLKEGALRNLK